MTERQQELSIDEMVVYEPLDLEVLNNIYASLTLARELGLNNRAVMALFSSSQDLIGANPTAPPIEELREVSIRIEAAQREKHGLIGKTTVYATLLDFNSSRHFPWHSEIINDAYVTSTLASTEGLSGTIQASAPRMIEAAVHKAAEVDEDLKHIKTLEVVRPKPGSLIHLPYGVVHRSPSAPEEVRAKRLLVNAVVTPNFMMTLLG
jgi:hypothetical protein